MPTRVFEDENFAVIDFGSSTTQIPKEDARYQVISGSFEAYVAISDKKKIHQTYTIALTELQDGSSAPLNTKALVDAAFRPYFGARDGSTGGGGATNISATASPTGVSIGSSTGAGAVIGLVDATNAGLVPPVGTTGTVPVSNGTGIVWQTAAGGGIGPEDQTLDENRNFDLASFNLNIFGDKTNSYSVSDVNTIFLQSETDSLLSSLLGGEVRAQDGVRIATSVDKALVLPNEADPEFNITTPEEWMIKGDSTKNQLITRVDNQWRVVQVDGELRQQVSHGVTISNGIAAVTEDNAGLVSQTNALSTSTEPTHWAIENPDGDSLRLVRTGRHYVPGIQALMGGIVDIFLQDDGTIGTTAGGSYIYVGRVIDADHVWFFEPKKFASGSGDGSWRENFSGLANGATTITVATTLPTDLDKILVVRNGVILTETLDYSVAGQVITLVVPVDNISSAETFSVIHIP